MTSRPGEHVVLVGGPQDALAARQEGLQVRDTLLLLLPGGRVLTAFLCRCPLEGTVAENVLKHGVGGLWIDGCRIGTDENRGRPRGTFPHSDDSWGNGHLARTESHPSGRWPTNLVLVHGPGCRCVGTQRVPAHAAFGRPRDSKGGILNKTGAARKNPHPGFGDEAGLETVAAWECQPDCPVRIMDEQSGLSMSKSGGTTTKALGIINDDAWKARELPRTGHDDAGGASRFYPQFSDLGGALDWLVKLVNGPS